MHPPHSQGCVHSPLMASSSLGSFPTNSSFLSSNVQNSLLHAPTALITSFSCSACTQTGGTQTNTFTKWKTCLAVILLAQLNGTDPVKCEPLRVQIYTWRHSRMSKTSLACFLLSRICWALLLRSTLALFARFSVLFPELTLRFLAGAMFTG